MVSGLRTRLEAAEGVAAARLPSPNLIALDDRACPRDIGIIDFQDAMVGPAAYDLVSLLQDARVDVDASLETSLLDHYISRISQTRPGVRHG